MPHSNDMDPRRPCKAVIFDMDGCLVDSEPLCLETIAEGMRALGVREATAELVRDRFLGVGMSQIAHYVADQTDAFFPNDFAAHVETILRDRYVNELRLMRGVLQLLETLRSLGVATAIATGASRNRMSFTLEISRLSRFFARTAICVDDVKQGKPAPDIFLRAAERLEINPTDCLVLEDSPHGIRGAVAAGMRGIGFVGGSHLSGTVKEHEERLREAGAERVFFQLSEFQAFLTPLENRAIVGNAL